MSNSIAQPPISAKSDRRKENDNNLVFSYMTMRNLIGLSGMLLPFVLIIFTKEADGRFVEPSISDYYYTRSGDFLVVLMSVLGVFLFTYKGYSWKEKALTTVAAICAMGVAFSPTASRGEDPLTLKSKIDPSTIHTAINFGGNTPHLAFAAAFFIVLAIIALVYFPKSDTITKRAPGTKRTAKEKRNIVYKICGWTMIGSIAFLGLCFLIKPLETFIGDFPIVFVMETVAVQAFGISWLTKGETLWPDGEHYMKKAIRTAKDKLTSAKQETVPPVPLKG